MNELFEKFKEDFSINANVSDVKCKSLAQEPYHSMEQDHRFGEKKCILYNVELIIFNVDVSLKILSFIYDSRVEILKLEINIKNNILAQEMSSCKNFLQRKRNMNSTFEFLVKYCELFEMRRIISHSIFQRIPTISVADNTDSPGLFVQCYAENSEECLLDFNWRIVWNVDEYEVTDFIEFYANYRVMTNASRKQIKDKLKIIVHAGQTDFHTKFKAWKLLMQDLYGHKTVNDLLNNSRRDDNHIYEISDTDSDESVIEIDTSSNCQLTDDILILE